MMPHEFRKDLAESEAVQKFPFWNDVYRSYFGANALLNDNQQDGPGQRLGVDRAVFVPGSASFFFIDEKIRKANPTTGRVYDDILLEYMSSKEQSTPGWVCKPLLADYIAYANLPLGICYMLPVPALQRAWLANGHYWVSRQSIEVLNQGYRTLCTPVKVDELFFEMGKTLRIHFQVPDKYRGGL